MGINLIIEKESLYLLAVDTSRPKPPVRMPRVPASHISGGAPALPLQHYIEILTTLKHSKKEKKSWYVRERGQPQSSAPCTLEPVSPPTPSSKNIQKSKKKFFLISSQPPKKKKKKKKKS